VAALCNVFRLPKGYRVILILLNWFTNFIYIFDI
jgi:hypothetical protein